MKPVIETHALCKSYHGRPVVDHLNLTVPEGCVYGFLGPNGAGKSTTMKMLLGLVHPTGGSVELLGHTLNEANRIALLRRKKCGIVKAGKENCPYGYHLRCKASHCG